MDPKAGTQALKESLLGSMPDLQVSEEVNLYGTLYWLDVTKGKNSVAVEIDARGYGVSDLKDALPFTGPDHVFTDLEPAKAKVLEILAA